MNKKDKKTLQGIKIRNFNYWMIVIACILYGFLIYETAQISIKYRVMTAATQKYIACEKNAALVHDGSDELTEQVRLYAVTMKPEYMEAYFKEANVTRSRDKALEQMAEYQLEDGAYEALLEAHDSSNRLMEREIYSMRLISEAQGYETDLLPAEVQNIQLTEEDITSGREDKIRKAQELVFDEGYQEAKSLIENHITQFLDSIIATTETNHVESAEALEQTLALQRIWISILFVMNIITFGIITMLVVRPLKIYIKCVKDNLMFETVGSYEFKYLALTYNNIYELNAANQAMLKKKAEYDTLTGVMNRGAFIQFARQQEQLPSALLLIDIDRFKEINDGYGHDTGDTALKKVARLLTTSFRASDTSARIGGDEFVVLMADICEDQKDVIQKKVEQMNEFLSHPSDGLPPMSLSVGVAFSNNGYNEELYKKADKALYFVKEHGRDGCCFFDEKMMDVRDSAI